MRFFRVFLVSLLLTSGSFAAENRMTPELLWKLGRVSGGTLSADGKQAAYLVRRYDLAKNSGASEIHLVTFGDQNDQVLLDGLSSASSLQWGKGSYAKRLFFVGVFAAKGKENDKNKDQDEKEDNQPKTAQVWSLDPQSGDVEQVTNIENGVANLKVSPTGTHIAFTVDIKMDATVNDVYKDLPHADARIIDSLMYRHWNAWHDYAYSHLHTAALQDGKAGPATDLMHGLRADCPVPPFGGAEQFNWSPDGREIAYTAKIVNNWSQSTDSDIYLIDAIGGGRAKCITPGMDGYDNDPIYSPDGKHLAFHSMERPGFESDRNRIMLFDRASGQIREITTGLDQTTHGAAWSTDGASVLFVSEYRGTNQLFAIDVEGGDLRQITRSRFNWSLADLFPDGTRALVARQSMLRPSELAVINLADGAASQDTTINDELFHDLQLPTIEERWVRASDGKRIHNWVIYPPDFDPKKKWPLLVYCQGGPQGQIGQWFSFRWNFHLMAAQGYVVLAVNRRGLPGFGRAWNDQISGDWGGQAMQDILAAADDMMSESSIDRRRTAAIGASFGGYTVYWLMGQHQDRFCCMIAHCGVFNLESMYGSTEELFFPNWDLGGPYWKSEKLQQSYDRFSPHRFVGRWKTPLLVIHGEKDFRVPLTQGLEAFTAAQVQGVPSRFLYFPNEGHWVLGPQNGVLWHRVFFDWLMRYCKKPH